MTDEQVVWVGHPSQWRNFGWFASCLLLIPSPPAIWKGRDKSTTISTLSDQRLKFTRGVLSKTTEDLELYRVRDTKFQQNVWERMLGLGEIELYTTDETTTTISLPYIRDAEGVREKLRGLVEARRDAKRVRYLDAE
jgi:membrane protein YdbS with pleckstrin-like domain